MIQALNSGNLGSSVPYGKLLWHLKIPTTITTWVSDPISLVFDELHFNPFLLGYYIHSCQKMRYKGAFRPQYILGEPTPFPLI